MLCITLLWNLWNARNTVNAGETGPSPCVICSTTVIQVAEFTDHLYRSAHPSPSAAARWLPPPEDYLKVNIDGYFLKDTSSGGWGFCVRDDSGTVLGTGMGQAHHLVNALHAEPIACVRAIEFASEVGLSRIISETDAALLKSALLTNEFDTARHGVLFREAKFLLATSFTDFKVFSCKRECNSVAHVLVTHGAHMAQGVLCTGMSPYLTLYLVLWPVI